MSYNPTLKILTKSGGLFIDEVRQCLGSSSRNLSTLCVSSAINKWAKYKPVKHTSLGELTYAQRQSVNFGIGNIPYYIRVATMLTDVKNNSMANAANISSLDTRYDPWYYFKPEGGIAGTSASPYRLLDFDGYWDNAIPPVGQASESSYEIQSSGLVTITFDGADIDDDKTLKLQDFNITGVDFANMYLTLCLYNSSTQYYISQMVTGDDTSTAIRISQLDAYGIFFKSYQIPTGTFNAILFASDRVIPLSQTYSTTGVYAPLAMTKSSFTITSAQVGITFHFYAWRISVTSLISGSYTIVNADATGYVMSNITVEFLNSVGTTLHSTTVTTQSTIAAHETISSTTLTLATASVVSSYGLQNAVQVRCTMTVGGTQFQTTANIGSTPPQI